jgi:hypothetical protein
MFPLILQYLEQDAGNAGLYDTYQYYPPPPSGYTYNANAKMDFNLSISKEIWVRNKLNVTKPYAFAKLKILLCPSVASEKVEKTLCGIWTDGEYSPIPIVAIDGEISSQFGRTHYAGVAGLSGAFDQRYVGVLTNRSTVSLGNITANDGTSNTLRPPVLV